MPGKAAGLPLVLTMGEPAGIGGEIALKAWLRRHEEAIPPFVLIDDVRRLEALAASLGWAVPFQIVETPAGAASCWDTALPVLGHPLQRPVTPGQPDERNAPAVIDAIRRGAELVMGGQAAALVTNPIHKAVLVSAGFAYPGHTEFLGALAGGATPVMMLACPGLRVVPVTVHCSLADAIGRLSGDAIVTAGRITVAALERDFGIAQPRLAVAGLNPHAGEDGLFGREEIEIISPAVTELRRVGIDALGPESPDSLFHEAARKRYDAALCMYHDQALIPLKTIDFSRGVNITLGLPFMRTSPDHGTAFDIAGTGKASADSLIAALKMAGNR